MLLDLAQTGFLASQEVTEGPHSACLGKGTLGVEAELQLGCIRSVFPRYMITLSLRNPLGECYY